jgi:hypothetical protein
MRAFGGAIEKSHAAETVELVQDRATQRMNRTS